MSVLELSRRTGVPSATMYASIRRDSSIRYDHALRISAVLDIDIDQICESNPYKKMGPGSTEMPDQISSEQFRKELYINNNLVDLLMLFDFGELPRLDKILDAFRRLDPQRREMLIDIADCLQKNHTDSENKHVLRELHRKKPDVRQRKQCRKN